MGQGRGLGSEGMGGVWERQRRRRFQEGVRCDRGLLCSSVVAPPLGTLPSALGPLSFCQMASLQSYPERLCYRHALQNPELPPKALLHRSPWSHCRVAKCPWGTCGSSSRLFYKPDISGSVRSPVWSRLGTHGALPGPRSEAGSWGSPRVSKPLTGVVGSPKARWNPGGCLVCREAQRSHSGFSFGLFCTHHRH